MSMIKYVSPSGWDWERPVAMEIPISSRGLIGNDRVDFVKSAGHMFLDEIDNIKFAKDEVPVHLIALGASEAYGPNRNGDGFKEATCKQHHDTFVKFAKFFRNHKNKPERGDPHFGVVKSSAYNDKMRRVELLVALNKEKSAVDRNGGFVADQELEKIASGDDMAVSMACRVPYDTCSFCGNQAKTRADYCSREKCAAGGCSSNLTKLIKVGNDLHHLHVDNPNPTWFDISRVFRPADRIAYGAKADYLTKAASDNGVFDLLDYIKMAEDDSAPLHVIMHQDNFAGLNSYNFDRRVAERVKIAYQLAELEESEKAGSDEIYRAFDCTQEGVDLKSLGQLGTEKCAAGLGALADKKVILHLKDWAELSGRSDLAEKAASYLPGIYKRLVASDIERQLEATKGKYVSEKLATYENRTLASSLEKSHGLEKEAVDTRVALSTLRGNAIPMVNKSSDTNVSDEAIKLATDYALYKVACLSRIASFDTEFPLTARLCIRQNHTY